MRLTCVVAAVVVVCMLCFSKAYAASVDDYFVYAEEKSSGDAQVIEIFNGVFTLCEHQKVQENNQASYVVQCKGRSSLKKWSFTPPGKFLIQTDLPQADGNSYDVECEEGKRCTLGNDICIYDTKDNEAAIVSKNFFKARQFGGMRRAPPCEGVGLKRCRRTANLAANRLGGRSGSNGLPSDSLLQTN
jgi:hypothetical protein